MAPNVNFRSLTKIILSFIFNTQTCLFSTSFLSYQTNYELQVKLQLIQVMSTNSLEKVFDVKPFLDQFNVSTQKKAYIKKLIVQSFDQLKEHNLYRKSISINY